MIKDDNLNFVNGTIVDDGKFIPAAQTWEAYTVPVIFSIIFIVGVVGNGSLIWMFIRHKSMRSTPNTFIFNLAVGDLFVLLFTVPFTSTIYTLDTWPYGDFVCRASEFAKDTSVGVSVFTLTALSLDRYRAIARPVQSYTGGSKFKWVAGSLVVIWGLAIAFATPAAVNSHLLRIESEQQIMISNGTHIYQVNRTIEVCYPFPCKGLDDLRSTYAQAIILGRLLFHYLIPLFIIGAFYISMARHLLLSETVPGQAATMVQAAHSSSHHHSETQPTSQSQQQANQIQGRRKVAKMVLSFVALFAVCFFPLNVYFMLFYFGPDPLQHWNNYWNVTKIVGFCLAYTNSCINPIALYCVSTTFRKHFNQILCCCCPTHLTEPTGTETVYSNTRRSTLSMGHRSAIRAPSAAATSFTHSLLPPRERRAHNEQIPLRDLSTR